MKQSTKKQMKFVHAHQDQCIDHAEKIIENFQEMEKASHELFELMDTMLSEA